MERFYAHTKEGRPPEEWQELEKHLKNVAEMARGFAEEFGAGEWAYLVGLWHDLGKFSREFHDIFYLINDENSEEFPKTGQTIHV